MTKRYTIKRATSRQFAVDYQGDLDPQQYQVVIAGTGPVLVIAGAGSGKTRAITYRVARLIETGVQPARILLVTFTNKAAREMLRRVERLIGTDLRRLWGGTFHSIANRILRKHAESVGYRSNFTIIDHEDAKEIIESSIQESGIEVKAKRFPRPGVLVDMISNACNRSIDLARCLTEYYPQFEELNTQIELVAAIFARRKIALNSMDYDDLLVNWRRLLKENRAAAEYWSNNFEHILVDEYQDTNKIQAEIVDLVAAGGRNLMVVGDDAQSVFGWRGAHFENMYSFHERYPDVRLLRLETNYRSRPEILSVANASIKHNARQLEKLLRASKPSLGDRPALVPVKDVDQQAAFVAGRILDLRHDGIPLTAMAVLYRSHWHSLDLQFELTKRRIPYEVRSGVRFFEQAHIKDVLAYLRLIANPRDEVAWKRALKLIPGIGNATARRIWNHLAESAEPLTLIRTSTFGIRATAHEDWRKFVRLTGQLLDSLDKPSEQISKVLESGYREYVEMHYRYPERRLEDLRQLASFAEKYNVAQDFLSELALVHSERYGEALGAADQEGGEAEYGDEILTLSSIHQAKGLEWRAVFLIWAADGKFPSARTRTGPEDDEEERRLFYVAVTRAQDHLYFCFPMLARGFPGNVAIERPSRFITEVPPELFEMWRVDEEDGEPEIPDAGQDDDLDTAWVN